MTISKIEVKKFAKLLVEDFLEEKTATELQGTTQDHIDAFVVPIMTDVEDVANGLIAEKIRAAFDHEPLDGDDEWWSNRR